jgi:hypothetical protein
MIKNRKIWENFEKKILKQKLSFEEKLKIYQGMYEEAVTLGIISSHDVLEDIQKDIELSRRMKSVQGNSEKDSKRAVRK